MNFTITIEADITTWRIYKYFMLANNGSEARTTYALRWKNEITIFFFFFDTSAHFSIKVRSLATRAPPALLRIAFRYFVHKISSTMPKFCLLERCACWNVAPRVHELGLERQQTDQETTTSFARWHRSVGRRCRCLVFVATVGRSRTRHRASANLKTDFY